VREAPEVLAILRLHPEEEAVLLCVRAERSAAQDDRLRHLLSAGMDWDAFWTTASQQQVLPLVARQLTVGSVTDAVPRNIVAEARAIRRLTAGHNLSLDAELERIGRRLQTAGIAAVPLKGTRLALRAYGAIDARQVGDIDILVPGDRLEEARATLRQLGYALAPSVSHGVEEHSFHGVPFVRQGHGTRFVVELHWGLNNPQFVTVDYGELWDRVARCTRQSGEAGALRPLPSEETLLFLAFHLPKHDTGQLRLLADIDRLIRREGPGLDWPRLLSLARRWSAPWLLFFALHRAQLLFDTPLPGDALGPLAPARWRRALVASLAGPRAVLRPPAASHLRSNRFRLAYCAMLTPVGRSLEAYRYYLFAPYSARRSRGLWGAAHVLKGAARGLAWTALVFASCVADRK
jgi:hypothetical protein